MIYRKYLKRPVDIVFSSVLLLVGAIPMLILAVIVKTTSAGPVFFKQKRYSLHSKPFTMLKFRSMRKETPEVANQAFNDRDHYVTPVGKVMRKTSLDETPQLINVLKGEMSFIGPRPLADTDETVLKLRKENGADRVRPGISGLAQVNGRNNITDEEKAAYDAQYAKYLSLTLDLRILWATIVNVIRQRDIDRTANVKDKSALN